MHAFTWIFLGLQSGTYDAASSVKLLVLQLFVATSYHYD